MKKVLALILVLLMAMSVLAACGDKSEESVTTTEAPADNTLTQETLLGKWNMTVAMDSVFETILNTKSETEKEEIQIYKDMFIKIFDGLEIVYVIDFKDGNKYSAIVDTAMLEKTADSIGTNIVNYLKNGGLEEILAMQNKKVTVDALEEALLQQGITLEQYYDMMSEQLKEKINITQIAEKFDTKEGSYELTDDMLFIEMKSKDTFDINSEFKYTYDGTAITLLENTDGQTHPFTGGVLTRVG